MLAGALIVGLGAAGCGSSSTGGNGSTSVTSTTSTTGITKSEFLAKANAICEETDAVIGPAREKLGIPAKLPEVTSAVEGTIAPSILGEINAIKALGAPPGEEATVTNMLNLAQEGVDALIRSPGLLEIGDPFLHFEKVAHPYGLTSCAPRP